MWSNEFVNNRNRVIKKIEKLRSYSENTRKVLLHLGCGSNILPGFKNIDKFVKNDNIINYDISDMPYTYGTVDLIYCSHALEHLPIRTAKKALFHWSCILKQEGRLTLAVPDLEVILNKLLDPSLPNRTHEWFLYTLFGYQADPANTDFSNINLPVIDGQFHYSGYTKNTLTKALLKNGFRIEEIFSYDGWETPSIWVEAIKS